MRFRIGEISFVNYIPFAAADDAYPLEGEFFRAPPSELNAACRRRELDVSAVSFFAYRDMEDEYAMLPGFCIASDGPVDSVRLFSNYAPGDLKGRRIFFTTQSESSLGAFRAICRARHSFDPADCACPEISGADAALLIGDAALSFDSPFRFDFDLGALWKEAFSLPLTYAAIVVRRSIYAAVAPAVSAHLGLSLEKFEARRGFYCSLAARRMASAKFSQADADRYFSRLIYRVSDAAFRKSSDILHGKTH